jgi:hypothetical protein
LAIVVDNSSSITALDASKKTLEVYDALVSNSLKKFEIQSYRFDMEFEPSEQFDFQEHKPTWVEFQRVKK